MLTFLDYLSFAYVFPGAVETWSWYFSERVGRVRANFAVLCYKKQVGVSHRRNEGSLRVARPGGLGRSRDRG